MKQHLQLTILLLLILPCSNINAQKNTLKKSPNLWVAQPMQKAVLDAETANTEAARPTTTLTNAASTRAETEVIIGNTTYDLQTNSTSATRLHNHGNGNLSAIWTQGFDAATGYPGRGTGYNHFDGTNWLTIPTERIEANIRTGWPSIRALGNGDEVIVNHIFQAPFRLHQLIGVPGGGGWDEADIPNATPAGIVWPRLATGGSDGNTIHVVGVTTPEANGGSIYEGVDGHLLYYRSTDGGMTYDIQDMIIPGLDQSAYSSGSVDNYAIDAQGETVVIAHFGQFADVDIFKSTDNGATWTETTVFDFPLDNYVVDSGYDASDLPPYDSLVSPDPLAILTSDESGAVVLDNNGEAHVFFGQMYVQDADLTDGGTTYYPGTSGLAYWNESYGEDSIRVIADVIDANGNGVLDVAGIADIALYFASLTSFPSAGVDGDNNIYLTYSALMEAEEFININATPNQQHARHIYTIASTDNGETWTTPYDLINEEIATEPDLIPASEAVFPSVAKLVDDKVHIIYQLDFEPGLSVRGDMDPAGTNFISYIGFDVSEYGIVGTEEEGESILNNWKISPNPTADIATLKVELTQPATVQMTIFNLMGQIVSSQNFGKQPAGNFTETVNLQQFPKGTYFVKMDVDGAIFTKKLVKN